jgi:hypothetical protein
MTGFHLGFALLAMTVGTFLLVLGRGMQRTQQDRAGRGLVTEGTVVGSRWGASTEGPGERDVHAYPMVEFTDAGGEVRRFVHEAGTNVRPKEGRRVQVWYDPARPEEKPVIHGEAVAALGPLLLMGVGLLVLVVTVLSLTMIAGQG